MTDEPVMNEENSSNKRKGLIIAVVILLLLCCCITFAASAWFLGDSVVASMCEQLGVGC